MELFKKKISFLILLGLLFFAESKADTLLPSSLIFYDYPGSSVIVVDKSVCRLMVYRFQEEWELKQSFPCTTGKREGDKLRAGDMRTPNGVYWLFKSWSGLELAEYYGKSANVYGVGAFELSYPNYLDLILYGKNGDGIWIHGTAEDQPIATRGCISIRNPDFLKLADYVKLAETPVIIEEEVRFISADERNHLQQSMLAYLEQWRRTWESYDVERYLSFYSQNFRTGKWDIKSWSGRKRILNKKVDGRKIHLSDLSIFQSKGVYHIRFAQDYISSNINDIGIKELFVAEEQNGQRIISEFWSRLKRPQPASLHYAFQGYEEPAL